MSKKSNRYYDKINANHRALKGKTLDNLAYEASQNEVHFWTAMAVYKIETQSLRDAIERDIAPNLDTENVVSVQIGCFNCETPFAPELIDTMCHGTPMGFSSGIQRL